MAKMVRFENIGGVKDVVTVLGITRSAFTKLLNTDGANFPAPVATVDGGTPIYDLRAVREWMEADAKGRRATVIEVPLAPGTKLEHVNRDGSKFEAEVVDGGIRYGADIYPSPSAAGLEACGYPVNGWTFWRTADGATLDSLRTAATA